MNCDSTIDKRQWSISMYRTSEVVSGKDGRILRRVQLRFAWLPRDQVNKELDMANYKSFKVEMVLFWLLCSWR